MAKAKSARLASASKTLAVILGLRAEKPWKRTPLTVLHGTPLYKGEGRDPADWLSYRLIMLLSFLYKCDEAIWLDKALLCAPGGIDEVQSVANPGVDARHQIALILDLVAWSLATKLLLANGAGLVSQTAGHNLSL